MNRYEEKSTFRINRKQFLQKGNFSIGGEMNGSYIERNKLLAFKIEPSVRYFLTNRIETEITPFFESVDYRDDVFNYGLNTQVNYYIPFGKSILFYTFGKIGYEQQIINSFSHDPRKTLHLAKFGFGSGAWILWADRSRLKTGIKIDYQVGNQKESGSVLIISPGEIKRSSGSILGTAFLGGELFLIRKPHLKLPLICLFMNSKTEISKL